MGSTNNTPYRQQRIKFALKLQRFLVPHISVLCYQTLNRRDRNEINEDLEQPPLEVI